MLLLCFCLKAIECKQECIIAQNISCHLVADTQGRFLSNDMALVSKQHTKLSGRKNLTFRNGYVFY